MKFFFKIGLPWAISMGIVFYVGLEIGAQTQPDGYEINKLKKKNFSQESSVAQLKPRINPSFQIKPEQSSMKDDFKEVARGGITIVHVGVDPESGEMKARELPEWVRNSITLAPDEYKVRKR